MWKMGWRRGLLWGLHRGLLHSSSQHPRTRARQGWVLLRLRLCVWLQGMRTTEACVQGQVRTVRGRADGRTDGRADRCADWRMGARTGARTGMCTHGQGVCEAHGCYATGAHWCGEKCAHVHLCSDRHGLCATEKILGILRVEFWGFCVWLYIGVTPITS